MTDEVCESLKIAILTALKTHGAVVTEEVLEAVVALLTSENRYHILEAMHILIDQENPADEILGTIINPYMLEGVRRTSRRVRNHILEVLAAHLDHEDSFVRLIASMVLRQQTSLPEGAFKAVAMQLSQRAGIVSVLLEYRRSLSEETLEAVIAWFDDQDMNIRRAAAIVLRSQQESSEKIIRAIVARLDSQENDVREVAIAIL